MHLSRQQEFIQYEICLLEIEDNIQLANVAVVFVHLLYVTMYDFEGDEFIVGGVGGGDEEEGGVAAVDDFGI